MAPPGHPPYARREVLGWAAIPVVGSRWREPSLWPRAVPRGGENHPARARGGALPVNRTDKAGGGSALPLARPRREPLCPETGETRIKGGGVTRPGGSKSWHPFTAPPPTAPSQLGFARQDPDGEGAALALSDTPASSRGGPPRNRFPVLQDDVVPGRKGGRASAYRSPATRTARADASRPSEEKSGEEPGAACGLVVLDVKGGGPRAAPLPSEEVMGAPVVLAVAYRSGFLDLVAVASGVEPR